MALVVLVTLAGCGSRTIVGAGLAHSYGSVASSGTHSGIGLGLQVGHYQRLGSGSLGGFVSADYAGYTSDADGDGILWTEIQVRYRHDFEGQGQPGPYVALGPAVGYTHGYLDYAVAGGIFELGYEVRLLGPVALDFSVRERPELFIGGGTPPAELHNTLAIGLDLVILGRAAER